MNYLSVKEEIFHLTLMWSESACLLHIVAEATSENN